MDEEPINFPFPVKLARNYARLLSEDPESPTLRFMFATPETQEIIKEVYVNGTKYPKPPKIKLGFDFLTYAEEVVPDYLNEFGDIDAEDYEDLAEDYLMDLEEEWNKIYVTRNLKFTKWLVEGLRQLEPMNPLLLAALFDINGYFRKLDYARAVELFEFDGPERKRMLEGEGIYDVSFLTISYNNLLSEEITEINQRNSSKLVSILYGFKQKKELSE